MSKTIILDMNSPPVQYLCKRDKRLAKVISMVGPITYTTHEEDPYSFLVHEIIEQMLSVKAGAKIFDRLNTLCNDHIVPETIMNLTDEELRSIGTSKNKVTYIKALTQEIISGNLQLNSLQDYSDVEVTKKLTAIKGVGNWTAKMYLIFVLNRDDILPVEDVAFLQSYKWMYHTNDVTNESVQKRCKKWKPYSSIASRFLYRALDTGLVKKEFHLYK